jgi:hypothetical protein
LLFLQGNKLDKLFLSDNDNVIKNKNDKEEEELKKTRASKRKIL